MNFRNELKKIILGIVGKEEYDLKLNDNLENVLGYSSVDYIQMLAEVEDIFNIEFEIEDLDFELYNTFGSLSDLIENKTK